MSGKIECRDQPEWLEGQKLCLHEVSKDAEGEFRRLEARREECRDCKTLKTVHALRLKVGSHQPCDSDAGSLLDGEFHVGNLVHAFAHASGERRGMHAGTFKWFGAGFFIVGSVSGITNAGTHRPPAFEACQTCDSRGVMEGRFCGTILQGTDQVKPLAGCQVFGSYRIRFDPSEEGGEGGVRGTLEGLIACDCHD
jgi:hypothetical protein